MLINKKDKLNKTKERAIIFLKSRNGKLLAGACAAVLLLAAGIYTWNQGAEVREGLAFCEKGEYAEAQTCFKNAVIADNMNPENYNYLGITYLGANAYEDAQKQFQLALNLDSESQAAYRGLGIAALETKDYESAIAYFNQALEYSGLWVDEDEYDILWYRADAERAMKDYEAAAETYSALLELEGNQALLRYYRGDMYCLLGQKEDAMEDFDAAVKMKGNGYDLFWNIYDSMTQTGWEEEAAAYVKLTEQPGYVDSSKTGSETDIRKYQGMIAYICEDYENSIELLSAETLKKDDKAQLYLALSYEMTGDYGKALSIYLENISNGDTDVDAYNQIARYFIRRGKGEEAVTYLEQGIKSCSEKELKVLYYNLVSAYESCGDYEAALDALSKYESKYGEDEASQHERAFLNERIR